MRQYLKFSTYDAAYRALAIISFNMKLSGNVTVQWANIEQGADGCYYLLKPDDQYMEYLTTVNLVDSFEPIITGGDA